MQKVSLRGKMQDLWGIGENSDRQGLQELWVMKIIEAGGMKRKITQVVTRGSVLGLGSGLYRFGAVWSIKHPRVAVGCRGRHTVNRPKNSGAVSHHIESCRFSGPEAPAAPGTASTCPLHPATAASIVEQERATQTGTGQNWAVLKKLERASDDEHRWHCCHLLSEHLKTKGKKLAEQNESLMSGFPYWESWSCSLPFGCKENRYWFHLPMQCSSSLRSSELHHKA